MHKHCKHLQLHNAQVVITRSIVAAEFKYTTLFEAQLMLAWCLQVIAPPRTHSCKQATHRVDCQLQTAQVTYSAISFAQTAVQRWL